MKLVTCPNCGAKKIGPKTERWPSGGPVMMGHWTGGSSHPVIFKCHRCTGAVVLSVVDFNRLPEMTTKELRELAPYTQDAVD